MRKITRLLLTIFLTLISLTLQSQTANFDFTLADTTFGTTFAFGCGPMTITFNDTSTPDGAPITTWAWDFGDGSTSTLQSPTHTYQTPGVYTVSLTVTDNLGSMDTETKTNYVQVTGPGVSFSTNSMTLGNSPLTVNFTDNTTHSNPPVSYLWNFGDGTTSNTFGSVSHTYTTVGFFDVTLTVIDLLGCSRTFTRTNFVNTIPGAFDVSGAIFEGNENGFSVASQETKPHSLIFNTDGTKMYVMGIDGDDINEYNLSIAYDVSTAIYDSRFSVSSLEGSPLSLAFNNAGSKVFVVGESRNRVTEYSLSTNFDISTAARRTGDEIFDVSAQTSSARSLAFNGTGSKMFVLGNGFVNEYSLSINFDVSTATYAGDGERFSVTTQEVVPYSLSFSNDGTRMFILGNVGDDINEYNLSVAFDVSTAVYAGDAERFSFVGQEAFPRSLAFNADGTKMYVMGEGGDDINQYSLAAPVITEAVANQPVNDDATINPFSSITIQDPNGDDVSATITLDDNAKGVLSGTGLSGSGPYILVSTNAASLQASLRALVFNPTDNRTNTTETTNFTLTVNDGTLDDVDTITTVISSAVAPTITITSVANDPINGAFAATFTFSENVTGFTIDDIVVGNGVASNFQTTSPSVYTATITPATNGVVTIDVAANVAQDAGNSQNTPATQFSIDADLTAPSVTITSGVTSPTNAAFIATFTFSEDVSGFTINDITTVNGLVSNFQTTNASTYTATITPTASGTITIDVAANVAEDGAANQNTPATQFSINADLTAPTVTITSTQTSPTKVNPIPVTITFSEEVTGLVVGDVSVNNGTLSNFATTDNIIFTADVTPITDGNITIDVIAAVAQDLAGNNNTASTQYNIFYDTTAPVPDITNLPDIIQECIATVTAPSATDNFSGAITATTTDPLTYNSQGTFTVTWTYDDGNGNTSQQVQTVIVDDTTAPVPDVTTLADATGECTVTVTPPTATDNCEGVITATTTDPLTYNTQGTFTVTWTYNDGNGNTSQQQQTVIVDDTTAPVADVVTLADATGECTVTVTPPTATDNCEGLITATTTDPLTYNTQGTFTVTWTYDDGNGNTSQQQQTVIVDDTTAPVADVATLADATGECTVTVTPPTAIDNCEGVITATTTDPLTYNTQGTFTVTWTYDDGNGNTSQQQQTVIIDDVTAPVADVATLADATGECTVTVTPPTATDNCEGVITATTTDPLTYNTQGTFTVTWAYDDGNGNTSQQVQTVIVDDVTPPVAISIATLTIQLDTDGLASIMVNDIDNGSNDNCGIASTSIDITSFTCTNVGDNTVTLTVTDIGGNISTTTTTVTVEDNIAPTANCVAPFSVFLDVNGQATITTADIDNGSTDNCGIANMSIDKTTFDHSNLGDNTVVLTVVDIHGNVSTCNTTVTVIDNISPDTPQVTHISEYTCTGNTQVTGDNTLEISGIAERGSTVEVFIEGISIGTTMATDAGFYTYDHTGTVLADGTYNITITATDIAGNTSAMSAALTITINSVDTDGDGTPDFCDDDADGDDTTDDEQDCDGDGIVDSKDTDNSACRAPIQQTRTYGFSPNGDGINDGWTIENITAFPNNVVSVYSRSGKLVFKQKGYKNDWEAISNQISNSGSNNRLPVGPYIYLIDLGDGSKPSRGWLYINY